MHEHIEQSLPRITVVGGGTGTSNALSELKFLTPHISAIINTSDNDGSSGQLVRLHRAGLMPMGDIRQCLAALSPYALVSEGYNLRDDHGHPRGNLQILESYLRLGNFAAAVKYEARQLNIIGEVIPVTTTPHELCLQDGAIELRGESNITNHQFIDAKQARIYHEPMVKPHASAVDAVLNTDALFVASGNLFSSVLPVIAAISDAIRESNAEFIVSTNLVNRKGQQNGWHVMDYIDIIERHAGRKVDTVIYNTEAIPADVARRNNITAEDQVSIDPERFNRTLRKIGAPLVSKYLRDAQPEDTLLSHKRNQIVHDAKAIARIVFDAAKTASANSAA